MTKKLVTSEKVADEIAQLTGERITGMLRPRAERAAQENFCSRCLHSGRRSQQPCPKFEVVVNRLLSIFWRVYVQDN